jgi:hypothetical protein
MSVIDANTAQILLIMEYAKEHSLNVEQAASEWIVANAEKWRNSLSLFKTESRKL